MKQSIPKKDEVQIKPKPKSMDPIKRSPSIGSLKPCTMCGQSSVWCRCHSYPEW